MPKPKIDYSPALEPLKAGKLAVIPTDTIYGIVCSALQPEAIQRLYRVRHRENTKPSIILLSDASDIHHFKIEDAGALRGTGYWPGPITLIFPAPNNDIPYVGGGTQTLSFRVPKDDDLRAFIAQTGPLVAPSANLEGHPPATTIAEAKAYFGDQVSVYIDGGRITGSPSKVIALDEHGNERIIRP